NLSGSPAQNFVVADDKGRIAWTILGRVPKRVGFEGRLPSSWADGSHRWDGWLSPEDYPRVVEPDDGRHAAHPARRSRSVSRALAKAADGRPVDRSCGRQSETGRVAAVCRPLG